MTRPLAHKFQPHAPQPGALRVGVFDSGVGGLSVLRALRRELPEAALLYVADSGHAPYGEKGEDFVVGRSQHIAHFLVKEQGCDMLVVACNTATAAAVHALRAAYPELPIVGIEPGVKPAVARTRNGRIAVMATEGTLKSQKFGQLVEQHRQGKFILAQPCPGLASAIESGDLNSPLVHERVRQHCKPLIEAGVDTVVLGCTHYPFVADLVAQVMGASVDIVDTSDAVARQAARLALQCKAPGDLPRSAVQLWSSGMPERLTQVAHAWLQLDVQAQPLP
jgi:glutamate racemase